jgi:hypothetical protein
LHGKRQTFHLLPVEDRVKIGLNLRFPESQLSQRRLQPGVSEQSLNVPCRVQIVVALLLVVFLRLESKRFPHPMRPVTRPQLRPEEIVHGIIGHRLPVLAAKDEFFLPAMPAHDLPVVMPSDDGLPSGGNRQITPVCRVFFLPPEPSLLRLQLREPDRIPEIPELIEDILPEDAVKVSIEEQPDGTRLCTTMS